MIELTMKNFLDGHLSAPSFFVLPNNLPSRYVSVERTGGGEQNHLLSSTFTFQSYADSLYDAAILNDEVKSTVDHLIELDEIRSVKLNSDYNFTDTTTKKFRYQAVYDIGYY